LNSWYSDLSPGVAHEYGYDKSTYMEPFCGMCSVLLEMSKHESHRKLMASDANPDIICLWNAIKQGWKPPTKYTETLYNNLKNSTKHSALRGFIGVVGSYGYMFFSGYRGKYVSIDRANSICKLGSNQLIQCAPIIQNISFKNVDYKTIKPKNMVIYCDPPYYNNTIKNPYFRKFNHEEFWDIIRKWSKNNLVFVSEYTAPRDFKCIWKKQYVTKIGDSKAKHVVECLFIHKSIIE
jgi:DNA adenine methylase